MREPSCGEREGKAVDGRLIVEGRTWTRSEKRWVSERRRMRKRSLAESDEG